MAQKYTLRNIFRMGPGHYDTRHTLYWLIGVFDAIHSVNDLFLKRPLWDLGIGHDLFNGISPSLYPARN